MTTPFLRFDLNFALIFCLQIKSRKTGKSKKYAHNPHNTTTLGFERFKTFESCEKPLDPYGSNPQGPQALGGASRDSPPLLRHGLPMCIHGVSALGVTTINFTYCDSSAYLRTGFLWDYPKSVVANQDRDQDLLHTTGGN